MMKTTCTILCLWTTSSLYAWSSISIHGSGHYNQRSTALSYANPQAPKGGTLHLGVEGSFDTLNPYSVKGYKAQHLSLIFETLGQKTLDDTDTFYPRLAEDFILARDKKSMTVKLYPNAQFSDGQPVTSEDLVFTFTLLKSKEANPSYASYWSHIESIHILSPHSVKVNFTHYYPELPSLVTDLPVLPKHIYSRGHFSKNFANRALGSGPYMIENFKFGDTVTFKRNPNYWAANHAFHQGRYNFDRIKVDYYRDSQSLIQAFKAGAFDFFPVHIMKTWHRDLTGKIFDLNWVLKEEWEHKMNLGALGYFFNLRKPIFQNWKLRKAIALAFDFPWTNRTLFFNEYKESHSIFENSIYKAEGLPKAKELDILKSLKKKFPDAVPDEVFTQNLDALSQHSNQSERMEQARELLKEAGYTYKTGLLYGSQGPLSFRFLLGSASDLRIVEPFRSNLSRLGFTVDVELKDRSVYTQKLAERDFDMTTVYVPAPLSPGQEQLAFWHSKFSQTPYSRNIYGLSNSAVDDLLESLQVVKTQTELEQYTHCLDRLIYHLHIAVYHWYSNKHRVAYWNRLQRPSKLPPYFFDTELLEFMWWDAAKDQRLKEAMQKSERF